MSSSSLPNIIPDHPIENKDKDYFQFHSYAQNLSKVIANRANKTPFVIGILGEWGSGKTSLLGLLMSELELIGQSSEAGYRKCVPVWFDAWKYSNADSIWLSLTNEIWGKVKEDFPLIKRVFYRLKSPFDKRRNWLGIVLNFIFQLITIGRVNLDISKFEKETIFSKKLEFYNEFQICFDGFVEAYRKKGKDTVIVVLIDDLDRCIPSKIVEVLEAIKVFMDRPNCVFVIALDPIVVQDAVRAYYDMAGIKSIDAKKYIDKIIQIKFPLPPVRQLELDKYIRGLTTIGEEAQDILSSITKFVSANPRRIKQFVNQFELQWAILESNSSERVDRLKLLGWLLFNEVSPELCDYVRSKAHNLERARIINEAIKYKTAEEEGWTEKEEGWLPDEEIVEIIANNTALYRMASSLQRHNIEYSASEMGYYIHLSPPPILDIGKDIQEEVASVLDSLPPKESRIIEAYFGIGCHRMSLEEIANEFGDEEETIHMRLARALRKCRHPSRSRRLKKYYELIPVTGEKTGEQLFLEGIFLGIEQ